MLWQTGIRALSTPRGFVCNPHAPPWPSRKAKPSTPRGFVCNCLHRGSRKVRHSLQPHEGSSVTRSGWRRWKRPKSLQPHEGSSVTEIRDAWAKIAADPSTPRGFVCNLVKPIRIDVRLNPSTPRGFVCNTPEWRDIRPGLLLQPHEGSSVTQIGGCVNIHTVTFNPTRVRL